ncbi:MAG: hypothetical protein WC745_02220 [Patescibacteria group bacterium]|jgi:hypothetical protein
MKYKLGNGIILLALAVGFFISTGAYIHLSQKGGFLKWGSPDETANYYFSRLYAREGKLSVFEKYNPRAGEIIHPRSFRSDSGELKPVSFLGLPLVYGIIGSFTTEKIIGYLTPFFAAIGIIYYYFFLKIFFSCRVALLSASILSVFPVYFYYSARSMFHNVLFMVFLIVGSYYAVISVISKNTKGAKENERREETREEKNKTGNGAEKNERREAEKAEIADNANSEEPKIKKGIWPLVKGLIFAALGGLFIGLAIAVRSSELLWLGPALFIAWALNFWRFGLARLVIFISFFALALLPVFYWNNILYGSPTSGGYPAMNESIVAVAGGGKDFVKSIPGLASGGTGRVRELAMTIEKAIFSFGINVPRSIKIFQLYFIKMFYWIFWPALAGLLLFVLNFKKFKKKHFIYILTWIFFSAILVLYYGSWEFYDNPDKNAATIGNSYTRYWLPVYLGAIPFASYLIFKIIDLPALLTGLLGRIHIFKSLIEDTRRLQKIFQGFLLGLVILSLFYVSANFTLFGSEEGLAFSYYKGVAARLEYEKVLGLTEANAVILTRYHDKIFFPERKVIVGLFDDPNMIAAYARVAENLPLYYYNFTYPESTVNYLNSGPLGKVNLKMEKVEMITDDFTLYRFKLTNQK